MSSDYRPRGGSSSSSSSSGGGNGGGGPRRRRGGRGRSGGGAGRSYSGNSHGHSHANGTSHSHGEPTKKSPFAKFIDWITGKKTGTPKPMERTTRPESRPDTRPDFDRERTSRAERMDRPERTERAERPRREERPEPTPQEIVTPKLYIGNLAYEAAESDLFDLFSKIGAVKNVEIAMDRNSSRSKGFGFVEMEVLETAKEAAAKLNRTDFMGRQIVVSGAKVDKRPSREEASDASSSTSSSEETSI